RTSFGLPGGLRRRELVPVVGEAWGVLVLVFADRGQQRGFVTHRASPQVRVSRGRQTAPSGPCARSRSARRRCTASRGGQGAARRPAAVPPSDRDHWPVIVAWATGRSVGRIGNPSYLGPGQSDDHCPTYQPLSPARLTTW